MESFWTGERTEFLRTSWSEGLTASQIASLVGTTRNSIIGKVHRLGLGERDRKSPQRQVSAARNEKRPRIQIYPGRQRVKIHLSGGRAFKGGVSVVRDIPLPVERSVTAIPIEQRKSLLELGNEHCRWPCGDPAKPDFFFCGAVEADFTQGRPYCRYHSFIACVPARSPSLVPRRAA